MPAELQTQITLHLLKDLLWVYKHMCTCFGTCKLAEHHPKKYIQISKSWKSIASLNSFLKHSLLALHCLLLNFDSVGLAQIARARYSELLYFNIFWYLVYRYGPRNKHQVNEMRKKQKNLHNATTAIQLQAITVNLYRFSMESDTVYILLFIYNFVANIINDIRLSLSTSQWAKTVR